MTPTTSRTWNSPSSTISAEEAARIYRKCGMERCARCSSWFSIEQRGAVWCPECEPGALQTFAPAPALQLGLGVPAVAERAEGPAGGRAGEPGRGQ